MAAGGQVWGQGAWWPRLSRARGFAPSLIFDFQRTANMDHRTPVYPHAPEQSTGPTDPPNGPFKTRRSYTETRNRKPKFLL